MKKTLHILLFAAVALMALTSCEKDEDGYYLASTYCTATVDGSEYIDRMKSKIPFINFGITSPYSYRITEGTDGLAGSDIWPVLFFETILSRPSGGTDSFKLFFYLRNVEPADGLVGREFTFSAAGTFDRFIEAEILTVMDRDKADIAISTFSGRYTSCTGALRIDEYNAKNNCITGTFTLNDAGTPITGTFHNIDLH